MDVKYRYDTILASAWLRGNSKRTGVPDLPTPLLQKPFEDLTEMERATILDYGESAGLKLYPFKRDKTQMPRVKRTLGFLRSIQFESLLDIGSGRGAFLFPFLNDFPGIEVTALDLLDHRIQFLRDLHDGGITRLSVSLGDVCSQPFPTNSFDVVTMLEVLEHIPDVKQAITAGVRMAKNYVVVSVPSKQDDNPEHIHLLTRPILTELFTAAGCSRLHFDAVEGHLILFATCK